MSDIESYGYGVFNERCDMTYTLCLAQFDTHIAMSEKCHTQYVITDICNLFL